MFEVYWPQGEGFIFVYTKGKFQVLWNVQISSNFLLQHDPLKMCQTVYTDYIASPMVRLQGSWLYTHTGPPEKAFNAVI